jgi:hypothetical protein
VPLQVETSQCPIATLPRLFAPAAPSAVLLPASVLPPLLLLLLLPLVVVVCF